LSTVVIIIAVACKRKCHAFVNIVAIIFFPSTAIFVDIQR
jgi:hypothetical protein